jgi:hypothetical protein
MTTIDNYDLELLKSNHSCIKRRNSSIDNQKTFKNRNKSAPSREISKSIDKNSNCNNNFNRLNCVSRTNINMISQNDDSYFKKMNDYHVKSLMYSFVTFEGNFYCFLKKLLVMMQMKMMLILLRIYFTNLFISQQKKMNLKSIQLN